MSYTEIANDVTARVREVVRYLRHSPKTSTLILISVLNAGLGRIVQTDEAKKLLGFYLGMIGSHPHAQFRFQQHWSINAFRRHHQ
jgi:hypothetical protein